ncbi:hypothetical protein ACOZB2_22610 [Pantoea endophytica]|uniref:Uncharacterized protein n=1 Tax=Pantoea sp. BJ2 TaxID=3141322 RepID=A0AAU7U354_9GAMM
MMNMHKGSLYSAKHLQHLLLKVATQLLKDYPEAKNVSLGFGGSNLNVLYPGVFKSHTHQFQSLGLIRHADTSLLSEAKKDPANNHKLSLAIKTVERLINRPINLTSVNIENQDAIDMRPEDRKDFKNSFTLVTAENSEQYKTGILTTNRVIENYEKTRRPTDEQKNNRLIGSQTVIEYKGISTTYWAERNLAQAKR